MGSWTWDLRSNDVGWSDELYRILGLDRRQRPSSEAFFEAVHPGDRAKVEATQKRSLATGIAESLSFRIVRPTGEVRIVRMDAAFLGDGSHPRTTVVGTIIDETDRRTVEGLLTRTVAQLDEAQELSSLGSWQWAPLEERLEWSEGMYRLFGIATRPPPTEALFYSHVHPDDVARVRAASERALASGVAEQFFLRIVRDDGMEREALLRSRSVRDADGNLCGFSGVLQDVTERSQLDRQLRHSQRMEAVSTLAGGVAHDFNNYLTVIGGHLELLAGRLPAENSLQASLVAIRHAADQCAALTRQLLTMSRKDRCAFGPVSVARLIQEMEPAIRSMLGPRIELMLDLDPESLPVIADSGQIDQVLMNLVINARDAMPDGGRLTIELRSGQFASLGSRPSACTQLTVSDTGIGIPKSIQSRIFEPFFTTKEIGRGSGLGLATVYGIVRDVGGMIEVSSEPGRGSTFHVLLRSVVGDPQKEANQQLELQVHNAGKLILVVDDNESVRRVTCALLSEAGYDVLDAKDGETALALLGTNPSIDAVVSDVMMPGLDGASLERKLWADRPDLPCLLITGYSEVRLERLLLETRRSILRKPFSSADLLQSVSLLFTQRGYEHQG